MPFSSPFAIRHSPIAKFLILVTSYLLLVTVLTGCRAIGTARPAALQVTSNPEASIFLDGKHLGKTPFFSDQLKSKEYLVKLTAGEATYVEKVTLTEGTLTVINRDLNNNFLAQSGEVLWLEKDKSGLFVISMPSDTDITIDGTYVGKTPYLTYQIDNGEHKVFLSQKGYIDREFAVKTSKNYQLIASVTLASEVAKGQVTTPSPPPQIEKVEITKTPQGFLRVRKDPNISSAEIGRVATGDQFEIVQETDDWVKIKFAGPPSPAGGAGKQGWVSSQYTKKLP